jgi:hypothetical protein
MESYLSSRQTTPHRSAKKHSHKKRPSSSSFSSTTSSYYAPETASSIDAESTCCDSEEDEEDCSPARENPVITEQQPEFHRYTNRGPEQTGAWQAHRPYGGAASRPDGQVSEKGDEGAACTRREAYPGEALVRRTECI